MNKPIRCLCPFLRPRTRPLSAAASTTYLRFYQAIRSYSVEPNAVESQPQEVEHDALQETEPSGPRIRIHTEEFGSKYKPEPYPRITPQKYAIDPESFNEKYNDLRRGESRSLPVVVRGRIWSVRVAGSKLAFLDLFQNNRIVNRNGHRVQCVINYNKISSSGLSPAAFKHFIYSLHRGDVYSIKGVPHRTARGELSILVDEVPQLLSRCIQPLPDDVKDKETLMRNRHVDLLLNPRLPDIIQLRSEIIKFLRQYLSDDGHIEVQTPILADAAGGAIARPFQTSATEFSDRQIALRIAPELWLKRLILGGLEKVYEIGPSFRNEGIDMNHNPEFTTCEFYRTYTSLEELINMTENMFQGLSRVVSNLLTTSCRSLQPTSIDFSPPYPRLDFIPALESALRLKLPSLDSPSAQASLLQIFSDKDVPLPNLPTLPRLLDKLSSTYLEPQCTSPTWIINHPECLSPLSKSFAHPTLASQHVAARAELFVQNQELVNTYEEENSPHEQRRKFVAQLMHHEADEASGGIDDSYLQALEWGLPPTGGWGCGVDRLCMLFSGSKRIADVLSFGTLRNVVALGRPVGKKGGEVGDEEGEEP